MRITGRTTAYAAGIFSRAAFTACLFSISPVLTDEFYPDMGFGLILGFYLLSFILQRLMAKRGFSAAIYWVISTVIAAASFFLCKGSGFWMVCGIFISGLLAPKNIGRGEILLRIDLSVGCICLFAFLASTELEMMLSENVYDTLILLLAALALLLFSMVSYGFEKSDADPGRGGSFAGKTGIAALLAALVALVSVFIKAAGSGMQNFAEAVVSALKSLYMGLINVIAFVFGLIWKFFVWFGSFGKEAEEIAETPNPAAEEEPIEVTEEIAASSPLWFKILLAALIVAAVVLLLRYLSRRKMTMTVPEEETRVKTKRKSYFFASVKKAFAAVCDAAAYRIFCITRRNTVPGLVSSIEKRIKLTRKNLARKPCESPQAFLRRLSKELNADAFNELADLCELHFYGGSPQTPSKELIESIKKLC